MKITKFIFIALLITACAEDPGDLTETTHSNIDKINAEGEICENGKVREIVCGINNRGIQPQKCVSGQWINDGDCVDPDECVDGDGRIGTTICGNSMSFFEQECVLGKWKNTETCVCVDAVFSHYYKGFCWSNPYSNSMNWNDAIEYCEDLKGVLPTINELKTLIQNCPSTETGGVCGITDFCLSDSCWSNACDGCPSDTNGKYSVFEDTGLFWSSSEHSDDNSLAWGLDFDSGSIKSGIKSTSFAMVKCFSGCEDYETRVIECGLNRHGTKTQKCAGRLWVDDGECIDPDECVNGETRAGIKPCENSEARVFEQKCFEGKWKDTDKCVCIETFPNYYKGFCWSNKSSNNMSWDNAINYCEDLGGRLPNIQELRMLIKECPRVEYPQPDDQTDWCAVEDPNSLLWENRTSACDGCSFDSSGKYNLLGYTDYLWSSSQYLSGLDRAWRIYFSNGNINYLSKASSQSVICLKK